MISHPDDDDTIAAIATAMGGGVGIIRIAGPLALGIAAGHFRGLPASPAPRRLYRGWWHDGRGRDLDEGLAVVMPGPHSLTGDDVVELHLHGGALSLRRCLEVCWGGGARPAGPGEFTRRAFLRGKLDLTRAEAIADVVAARTDRALEQARAHLRGDLHDAAVAARDRVLELRARIEVNLDFVDEDVPLIDPGGIAADARAIGGELRALAGTWRAGRLLREGARVVLAGRPNAGKSSLFNALLARDRAIVSPIPGTTRDVVEDVVDIHGIPVILLDTAGLRATGDAVEAEGVARTERAVAEADLVLHVVDPGDVGAPLREVGGAGAPVLEVWSKRDLAPRGAPPAAAEWVSALTGEGLDRLKDRVAEALGGASDPGAGLTVARERQHRALSRAASALEAAAAALVAGAPGELAAVDVQEATDALGELLGVTTIEDVLDRLFGSFCIGK